MMTLESRALRYKIHKSHFKFDIAVMSDKLSVVIMF